MNLKQIIKEEIKKQILREGIGEIRNILVDVNQNNNWKDWNKLFHESYNSYREDGDMVIRYVVQHLPENLRLPYARIIQVALKPGDPQDDYANIVSACQKSGSTAYYSLATGAKEFLENFDVFKPNEKVLGEYKRSILTGNHFEIGGEDFTEMIVDFLDEQEGRKGDISRILDYGGEFIYNSRTMENIKMSSEFQNALFEIARESGIDLNGESINEYEEDELSQELEMEIGEEMNEIAELWFDFYGITL